MVLAKRPEQYLSQIDSFPHALVLHYCTMLPELTITTPDMGFLTFAHRPNAERH